MYEDAMGFNQAKMCEDPLTALGVKLWLDRVFGYYGEVGGGVDIEVIAGQLILNRTTAPYIYGAQFTDKKLRYVKGSRPLLEQTVAEVFKPKMSPREKVLALMRRCRDNRDRGLKGGTWSGGNEEELLKRGAIMCNEIHRVFVCLCQIAGFRARLMGAHISGHMMAEVEVDGRWWWIDCMKGWYCFNDDGSYASVWDLLQDPTLFDRQPKALRKEIRPPGPFTEGGAVAANANVDFCYMKNRYCYFHPKEAVCIGNYYAWDSNRYTYPWHAKNGGANPDRLFKARLAEAQLRRKLGMPDANGNHYLLDVKMPHLPRKKASKTRS